MREILCETLREVICTYIWFSLPFFSPFSYWESQIFKICMLSMQESLQSYGVVLLPYCVMVLVRNAC